VSRGSALGCNEHTEVQTALLPEEQRLPSRPCPELCLPRPAIPRGLNLDTRAPAEPMPPHLTVQSCDKRLQSSSLYLLSSACPFFLSSLSLQFLSLSCPSICPDPPLLQTRDTTNFTHGNMASVEVPKKHKALVYDRPGSISTKIEELDTPEPGVGEVLVNL
jgi:hypothetical protein